MKNRTAAEILATIADCEVRVTVVVARLQQLHAQPAGLSEIDLVRLAASTVTLASIACQLESELEALADLLRREAARG